MTVRLRERRAQAPIATETNPSAWRSRTIQALSSRKLLVVLVAFGVFLRVWQYAANRSLWYDEALLALNFIDKPFAHVLGQLDLGQSAPIGFLIVEDAFAKVVGYSEYALRLFPLIWGVLSVVLFAWVARRFLGRAFAPLALLLFCVPGGLVYYASEVKPYAADVAASVALLAVWVVLERSDSPLSRRTATALAVVGVAAVAVSFAAIFVVCAVAAATGLKFLLQRRVLVPQTLALSSWLGAAIAVGLVGATGGHAVRNSFEASSGRFLGVDGSSPVHAANMLGADVATSMGFVQSRPYSHLEKLAVACALVGALAVLRRRPARLLVLVLPIAAVYVASFAQIYPITERTELFLIPLVILLMVEGVKTVVELIRGSPAAAVGVALAAAIAAGPAYSAAKHVGDPRRNEDIRPVLAFVRDHWKEGDAVYVHRGAQYALFYYARCGCFRMRSPSGLTDLSDLKLAPNPSQNRRAVISLTPNVVIGRNYDRDRRRYVDDLERLRPHRRVWFLYSHVGARDENGFIRRVFLARLDSLGRRVAEKDRTSAHAYLYDISSWR